MNSRRMHIVQEDCFFPYRDFINQLKQRINELEHVPYNRELFKKNFENIPENKMNERATELMAERSAIDITLNFISESGSVKMLINSLCFYMETYKRDVDITKVYGSGFVQYFESYIEQFRDSKKVESQ